MSTPIEIVRELVTYRGMRFNDKTQSCITTALAAVLRDAERFKALAEAHDSTDPEWGAGWCYLREGRWSGAAETPLSELADRLMEDSR